MTRKADLHEAFAIDTKLGECPTWDSRTERLVWVDILKSHIHSFDPTSGMVESTTTHQHVGAAKPRRDGGLVVNLRDGVGVYNTDGQFRWIHHAPVPGRRGNDAAVAPDGVLWAGTMRYDEASGGGTLTRTTPEGDTMTVLDDVTVSNGIGWSPDARRMYYIDSPTRRIDVFDYNDGHLFNRRTLVEIEPGRGYPDGLTVDADGAIWVALWDGAALHRYSPSGRLDRTVPLPTSRPTACAFGGRTLTDLYISTASAGPVAPNPWDGSLLVIPGAGNGLPQLAYPG
ncbi:SMP-30/gluconolactonase/LRE family protein [Nocardia salmonicida]|uniref:SMP-30/gluconolactonase/LRE family protein n=1 Tax=Nocardia salmonicida TaxID=53431 RepID=UPI0007A49A41|nr:SMP-30/gluconolactonase/LRE family protein [Nocardia salmonicida]